MLARLSYYLGVYTAAGRVTALARPTSISACTHASPFLDALAN